MVNRQYELQAKDFLVLVDSEEHINIFYIISRKDEFMKYKCVFSTNPDGFINQEKNSGHVWLNETEFLLNDYLESLQR